MTVGAIDGSSDCDDCGTCGCTTCPDGKFWTKLKKVITGVSPQSLYVDTDYDGDTELGQVIDLSALNGEFLYDAIYHNGKYKSGYDIEANGPVGQHFYTSMYSGCFTVYERQFDGLGDLYAGATGIYTYGDWTDEGRWLRNISLRERIYVRYTPAGSHKAEIRFYTVYPPNRMEGEIDFEHAMWPGSPVSFPGFATNKIVCDDGLEFDLQADTTLTTDYRNEVCQYYYSVFFSDTDSLDYGVYGLYDFAFYPTEGPSISYPSGSANWVLSGAGERVVSL